MLKFIIPNESHKSQWEEIIAEWDDTRKRPRILFQPSFEEFINRIGQLSRWDDKEKQVAKSSVFLLIDETVERILGCLWLRHHIDFPIDREYGGHIGYGIRPSARGKWYATEMLQLWLQEAKKLWIDRILITCDDDNIASAKVIEANGGILEKCMEKDGVKMRRYWINLL
jgi:predicted acetyltransferase